MRNARSRRPKLATYAVVAVSFLLLPTIFVHLYAAGLRAKLTGPIWTASSQQETVERFAQWAAGYWQVGDKKDVWNQLRGLPKPFKPQKEPINFLSGGGLCTELVASARWVLSGRLHVVRHDILFPAAGHSAISVRMSDGRWVFIDPFLGWIFEDGDRLLSLRELRENLVAGHSLQEYAIRLKADASTGHYAALLQSFDAKEFETMDVRLQLPLEGQMRWSLGEIDGDWHDVQQAGQKYKLTSHFFYIGRRYPVDFVFRYLLPDDGRTYTLTFHLTKTPSPAALPHFSICPSIEGKILRFRLTPAQRTLIVDTTRDTKKRWFGIDRFEVISETSS